MYLCLTKDKENQPLVVSGHCILENCVILTSTRSRQRRGQIIPQHAFSAIENWKVGQNDKFPFVEDFHRFLQYVLFIRR